VQLGTWRPLNAVTRPRSPLLAERAVVGRVPIARRDHEVEARFAGELVETIGDLVAARHRQRAARREVVLKVDDDERLSSHRSPSFPDATVAPR